MSHIHQGPLATYNSLTDGHLSGYFSNGRMRRHLRKAGLVSKQGEIVSESTYRLNMSRKEHKKQVKDMLAQAIVHKTLDLERTRQAEIKKKLEEISKIQLVRRVRASTGRKGDEDILPYLTPRSRRPGSSPAYKHSGGQASQSKLRPNSAPGVRSESRHSQISVEEEGDVLYLDDDGRPITPANVEHGLSGEQSHIDSRHLHTLDTAAIRKYAMLMSQMEEGRGVTSPYMMSQVPLPPKARLTNRSLLSSRRVQSTSASPKRPVTTTDSRIARLHRPETAKAHAGDLQTMCRVLMKYHGWALNLAREKMDPRQEVVVEQQHCGGNTLTVFKERVTPGTTFEFISYRHRGYPFSLTLYLDGQMDSRVSTCCEYRHSRGAKIGGKQGHFSLLSVEGAIPCYKCQVAKGVLVRGKATPRKTKRPSERHMEEVIVVATKKDDDQDDDHDAEWRTKQAKPVGEEDRAVMVAVEGDDDDHGDKTPKSPADKDTTYDDDFDDSKSSASSRSSSESDSETESSARQRDEDYNCSGVRNKERGQEEPAEEVETQPLSAGTHSSRLKSASHRRPPLKDSSQDQSPERAVYTDTVTPRHSRSPSPHSSPPPTPPRKRRGKKKAKAAVAGVVSTPPRENKEDADVHETKPTKEDKESREHPREVKGEKPPRHVKEEADTADEVSEIESEIVSPRKLEAGGTEEEKNASFTSQPKSALSDLPEEGDSIQEDIEPCRGEDDTLKQDADADSLESRGDEEREARVHPTIKLASCKEAVKRKGLRNENRSKSHALSSPERTPRSPKSASSQVVQGMELSDPTSQSSNGEEDHSESCVSQSWASHSETYTKLMQRDERAFPCEEQGPVNGYTLSSSKDNIIKRSKAQKKRRRRKTDSPRPAPGTDKVGQVVEVEQPVKIPSISVGAPASYDTTGGGKHQLEIVIGTEPSSRQFLQDDFYILHNTSQPANDHARETAGDSNEKPAEVPAIVVSSVPQATIDFSPVPMKNIPEKIPCMEAGMNERGCEEMSQGEESETEVCRSTDNIQNTAQGEDKGTELYTTKGSNNREDNAEEGDRTTVREVCGRREDDVINIICQEPDSPPANQADPQISISKVRRLSVELGTNTENVVLAHLKKLSPDAGNDDDDDDAAFNRQAVSADNSGEDTGDGGQMIRRRRQSSLTVPLDAEALKLTERWVMDQDRPKLTAGHQKKTVTWTETEDKSMSRGDESQDVQSFKKEGETQALADTQAVMNGNAGEDGIRVYACDEDGSAVRESGDSSTNNLPRNANDNQDEDPPVVRNTEGNTEVLAEDKKPDTPKPSAKEDAENLYDDNDFEKEDDDSSSSSSSSSSSTWTSDSSNSSSSSSGSGSSSSSASEAAPPSRKSSSAMNLSMLAMSDLLQKNRHIKRMEPAKSSTPSRQNSLLSHKGPGSLSPVVGPVPESENETSDLDRSMRKESDTDNKTGNQTVEKPAPHAKGDDSDERDTTVMMKTITDSHPTVLVSYPDDDVLDGKGQKLKQDVDDQGERSDVDSAYDAKMSSTSSLKGNIGRLVEDIEVEEKGKDVYSIPTNVLL